MVKIYTDGSCRGNGKENSSGGWGVAAFREVEGQFVCDHFAGEPCEGTTNNREELKAMLYALMITQYDTYRNEECIIYSDSAYVVNMCREWIWNWQSRGWTRAGDKPIENLDLVKQIYIFLSEDFPNFTIIKVKGHAGELGNELADAIATSNKAKIAKIMEENRELFPGEEEFDF